METPKRKKGGKKRTQINRPSLTRIEPTSLPPIQFTLSPVAPIQPQKPFSEVLGELVGEIIVKAYTSAWEKASPGSYALNRAIYAVAPYCRPEASGALNAGALITFGYGLKQIADNANRRGH